MGEREELLPCPFCSGKAGHGYTGPLDGSGLTPIIRCWTCNATVEGATFGIAIVRWNSRSGAHAQGRVTSPPNESLPDELTRLVDEWRSAEGGDREEAWNLIADFTCCNWWSIVKGLNALRAPEAADPDSDPAEIALRDEIAADNLRLIDFISDKIGQPQDKELTREDFLAWFSRSAPEAADAGAVAQPLAYIVHDDPELGDYLTRSKLAAESSDFGYTALYASPTDAGMREALEPFAELVPAAFAPNYDDEWEVILHGDHGDAVASLKIKHFRAAAAALALASTERGGPNAD